MKKNSAVWAIIVILVMIVGSCAFTACGRQTDGLTVVVTVFPEYDWVQNVLGDASGVNVVLLQDSGADLHSYQPTVEDIATLSACDLFVYVGGESDEWAEDALKNATNRGMRVLNLLEILGDRAKEEELADGMEGGEEEEEGETEYDEHVWLSLRNAAIFVDAIARELAALDEANAETYARNATAYKAELARLDSAYTAAVQAASKDTILFGDRFPFRYLTEDYGLRYYAAFSGCSAETEASFETIVFLSGKVDELGLNAVIKLESSDGKIAQTVVNNTRKKDCAIVTLDSLQSSTKKEYAAGRTYLAVMEENLANLKIALS